MKINFKPKSIIALALVLFMVVPMLFVALPSVKAISTPVLSVVPDGAPGATTTTVIAGLAVGSTFTVDIRVDNIASVTQGINGLSYSLTYNPAVLQLTARSTKDPSFWGAAASDVTAIVTTGSGIFTESSIIVPSGAPSESTNTAGIATTITFKVLTTGSSNLNFAPSDVGVAYLTYPDASGNSHDVVATPENAIYNLQTTSIGLYQHGTTNTVVTLPANSSPIGSTFTLDCNITNGLAEPIWGYNVNVAWNPAVLQLETITEGTYLNSAPGLYAGSSTIFVAGTIDNVHGTILQGVSDVYLSNQTTNAPAGTLFNLTFEVINYANSTISLSAGIPTLIDNLGNSQSAVLNNAQYVTNPPPAAHGPTAVITNQNTGSNPTNYQLGSPIELSGLSSTPGFDVIPNVNSPNQPITTYSWTQIGGPAVTGLPATGAVINLTAPAPNGNITIQLTVSTAPDASDPSYVNTGTATIVFTPGVIAPTNAGPQIDLYIINNVTTTAYPLKGNTSLGTYNTIDWVDSYAPQQIMNLGANVQFNGAPVADKLVTFIVTQYGNPTDVIATFVAYTDQNGNAYAVYRLPNYNSTVMPFGTYEVNATVDVAQNIVSDAFLFNYQYTLSFTSINAAPQLVARGRDSVTVTANILDWSFNAQPYFITYTITDANNVPVVYTSSSGTDSIPMSSTYTTTATLAIPSFAFAGTATVHVDLFNANPNTTANGLPYCPEATTTFQIGTVPSS